MFFNIVKNIFKSIAGLLTSGKVQIASRAEKNVVLAGLRKKYLTRCQASRSKYYLYTVYTNSVFLNIVKDLLKSIAALLRRGKF